jgi:aconitate hydratase
MQRFAPRNLGLRLVLVKSFARIHRQNLINYDVLPLVFADPKDYDRLDKGDVVIVRNLRETLETGDGITFEGKARIATGHDLTPKQIEVILAGGLINWRRDRLHRERDG